jgi:hypothetical protein
MTRWSPKQGSFRDANSGEPQINRGLVPCQTLHCSNISALSKQIDDGPVVISFLQVRYSGAEQLGSTKAAAKGECQHGMVPLALYRQQI